MTSTRTTAVQDGIEQYGQANAFAPPQDVQSVTGPFATFNRAAAAPVGLGHYNPRIVFASPQHVEGGTNTIVTSNRTTAIQDGIEQYGQANAFTSPQLVGSESYDPANSSVFLELALENDFSMLDESLDSTTANESFVTLLLNG